MADTDTSTGFSLARTPRWLKALLAASLAVNLLIAGLAIGAMLRHGGKNENGRFMGATMRTTLLAAPEARKEEIEAVIEARQEQFRTRLAAVKKARTAVQGALLADPYDDQALSEALDGLSAATTAMRALSREGFLEVVNMLGDEERKEFAAALAKHRKRRGKDREPPK